MTDQPAASNPAASDPAASNPATGEPAEVAESARADLAAIMRLAPGSEYGDLVAHETFRRRKLYELLANSDDPLWKEIGTQLRDGQMQPRDMLGVDAYRTHLVESLEKHGGDFGTALAKARDELEADQSTRR
jgi:hypothetical protein